MDDLGMRAVLTADITSFEGAMLAALSIAKSFASAFESTINQSMNRVAKVFKDSGNFDISVGAMQKLQFAASQTGTSMTHLETTMRRLEKNLGEATFGNKTSIDTFSKLGLDFKELARLPIDQQMLKIGDAFNQIHNTAQAATLSMRLFGIAGTREMQFLKELGENAAKFERLMKPQSELDGSKIYGAKQALREFGSILDNIFDQISSKISPVVTNIIEKMEDWGFTGKNLQKNIDAAWESLQHFAVDSIAWGMAFSDVWKPIWQNIKTVFEGAKAYLKSLAHDLGEFILAVEPALTAMANTFTFINHSLEMGKAVSSVKDSQRKIEMITGLYEGEKDYDRRGYYLEQLKEEKQRLLEANTALIELEDNYNKNTGKQSFLEILGTNLRDGKLNFGEAIDKAFEEMKFRAQFYKSEARKIVDDMAGGRALAEAEARLPRGRFGDQELMDSKSSPIGYALQITSAANIPSMQLAAKEVQEVHAPGVEKAIERLDTTIQEKYFQNSIAGFGP